MIENIFAGQGRARAFIRSRGFTLVELLVVICIIAILSGVLFKRVLFYQEMAEKAAMQQVVGALQSGLIIQFGHQMTLGSGSNVNIINENPVEWLMQKPGNYAGEFNAIKPDIIAPGMWAFDNLSHELIYVPEHNEFLEPASDGNKWIRFKTKVIYDSIPGNNNRNRQLVGVTLLPVEPYKWLIKGGV
jgi:prepilin-type N-terminal cleavage/methylation domain-containing protein